MELKRLGFNEANKKITISKLSPSETVEAVKQLIQEEYIEVPTSCYFECKNNKAITTLESDNWRGKKFDTIKIHTINLLRSKQDRDCAIALLDYLNIFDSEFYSEILSNPREFEMANKSYSISIEYNNSFIWSNDFGNKFYLL